MESYTVKQVAEAIGAEFDGDADCLVSGVAEPAAAGPDALVMSRAGLDEATDMFAPVLESTRRRGVAGCGLESAGSGGGDLRAALSLRAFRR